MGAIASECLERMMTARQSYAGPRATEPSDRPVPDPSFSRWTRSSGAARGLVASPSPHRYPCDRLMRTIGAEVAQSVEHRAEEAGVVSSILTLGTSNAIQSGEQYGRKWLSW